MFSRQRAPELPIVTAGLQKLGVRRPSWENTVVFLSSRICAASYVPHVPRGSISIPVAFSLSIFEAVANPPSSASASVPAPREAGKL